MTAIDFAAELAKLTSSPGVPREDLDQIKAGLLALAGEPADAEQAHLEDEIQHPDFFDAVHHPAGHTIESEDQ